MLNDASAGTNWFDKGGSTYAKFRPEYPEALPTFLAGIAPDRALAVDVGCGNGQLTRQFANHFESVVGVDPSADQLANAAPHDRIEYVCAPAENLPLANGSASIITAAQAAHWFNLPRFYDEARRIAREGAAIALISYGVLSLAEPDLQRRSRHFYLEEVGPYWPPERKLVDTGYADIDFPFAAIAPPELSIECAWERDQFLGYVSTWSAVRRAIEACDGSVLEVFARDIAALWGEKTTRRNVRWPINMRLGRL